MRMKKIRKAILRHVTGGEKFREALQQLATYLGAPRPNEIGTYIPKLKKDLRSVFERVNNGSVEVITLEHQRFVVLSEEQALTLIARTKSKTVADIFAGLPTLTGTPPSMYSIKEEVDQYSLHDGKTSIP